jgi:D-alanine-D-alanine ligase
MKIVVLIDPESFVPEDPQLEHGPGDVCMEVEFHVAHALRELGHEVQVHVFSPDIAENLQQLREAGADLAFNLTEHYGGNRRMDKNIAALLDLVGIPYTGSGPTGLMLCRDKALCKRLLSHHRIRVPDFALLRRGETTVRRKLHYPLVVKPLYEDGSDGITLGSLVHTPEELRDRAAVLHERMKQPVICEEFIEGRELYLGLLGNRRLTALPARECRFNSAKATAPRIATARVKRDAEYCAKWGIAFTDADLDEATMARLARISKRIYRLLHLRDYGRIDVRITGEGDVVFLEANPNPDLTMGDELAEAASRAGIDYDRLVQRILRTALQRYRG